MRNLASPNGGFFNTGTISHGTLRSQDLLRAFADEYARLLPFNSFELVNEARVLADRLDNTEQNDSKPDAARLYDEAGSVIEALTDALDTIASTHGHYFGTLEGDGSDFGFWQLDTDED